MKKTLLLLCFPVCAYAQLGIQSFYDFTTANGSLYEDNYLVLAHPSALDESAAGEGVTWNFTELSQTGTSHTRVIALTDEESALYPDTDKVAVTRTFTGDDENVSRLYIGGTPIMETLITGINNSSGYNLQYSDDFVVAIFPTGYGSTSASNITGTFEAPGVSGTFSGEVIASCDAYGTLSVNNGPAISAERITITQNLQLFFMDAPIGTLTQTIHYYYNFFSAAAGPVFRSTFNHITIPVYNFNEEEYVYESYVDTTLKTNNPALPATVVGAAPNPVNDILHFTTDVQETTIVDSAGRIVLKSNNANNIDVSHLSRGLYIVNIQVANAASSLKIIKL